MVNNFYLDRTLLRALWYPLCIFKKKAAPLTILALLSLIKLWFCSTCPASITNSKAIISNQVSFTGYTSGDSNGAVLGPVSNALYTLHYV